jgi:hypothetical protein
MTTTLRRAGPCIGRGTGMRARVQFPERAVFRARTAFIPRRRGCRVRSRTGHGDGPVQLPLIGLIRSLTPLSSFGGKMEGKTRSEHQELASQMYVSGNDAEVGR